jgi:hypothetical protein
LNKYTSILYYLINLKKKDLEKRISILGILLCCGVSVSYAQQGVTIINNTSCDMHVRLGALNPIQVPIRCTYETGNILVPCCGGTVSAVDYVNFATMYPFVNPTGAPSPLASGAMFPPGPLPAWPLPDCFEWVAALVFPADAPPSAPGVNVGHPCGVTHSLGDTTCGPRPLPATTPHIWSVNPANGNLHLILN